METANNTEKKSLIYPWTVTRSFEEESISDYVAMGYNAVYQNYQRYFDVSPHYFDLLEDTPSQQLANDILAWLFKGTDYDAMWFSMFFVNNYDYPYVFNAARLACLVYSLTTGTASMHITPQSLTHAYAEAYKDEQSDLFDLMGSCGFLLVTGLDHTLTTMSQTNNALTELFQERIASPTRRTLILCQLPTAYSPETSKNKVQLGEDFASTSGFFRIPAAGRTGRDNIDNFTDKAQPFKEGYKLYPNHIDRKKWVNLPKEQLDFFLKARIEILQNISSRIGKTFAHNINNTSDSMYIY